MPSRYWRDLLNLGRDAFFGLDGSGNVVFWTPSATRMFGWSASEAVGRPTKDLFGPLTALTPRDWPLRDRRWKVDAWVARRDGVRVGVEMRCCRTGAAPASERHQAAVLVAAADVTEHRRVSSALARLSESVRRDAGIVSWDSDGRVLSWSPSAEEMFGWTAAEIVGKDVSVLSFPTDTAELAEIIEDARAGRMIGPRPVYRRHKSGQPVQVVSAITPMRDEMGEVVGASAAVVGMSEYERVRTERDEAELRFEAAFRHSSFGMIIADLNAVPQVVNSAMCAMMGRPMSELVGRRWTQFSHPDDGMHHELVLDHFRGGRESFVGEWRYIRPDNSVIWVSVASTLVRDLNDTPLFFMTQMHDVTDRRRMEVALEHRALHDDLTGLPNRALLDDRLGHALRATERAGSNVGVAFVDLDGFKDVNDALGHSTGDRLLVGVAHRMEAAVRPADTVARFGGDEYVVVCGGVTLPALRAMADRLSEALRPPFDLGSTSVGLTASIGLAISTETSTAEDLLAEADAAMYTAKARGRGRVEVFSEALRARATRQLAGESALRAALDAGRIVPYYQPIVDLNSGQILGAEALARWVTEDGNVIPPAEFIPLAEHCGLIERLGDQILSRAIADAATWNQPGGHPTWVSVNLSATQLQGWQIYDCAAQALTSAGLDPWLLHLEITETALLADVPTVAGILKDLRQLGVGIFIDDFGTGYSSLSYLRQLPATGIKIDRSFIDTLDSANGDQSIVTAILSLSEAFGLTCVAEGIETHQQQAILVGLGCSLGQGYRFGYPADRLPAHANPTL